MLALRFNFRNIYISPLQQAVMGTSTPPPFYTTKIFRPKLHVRVRELSRKITFRQKLAGNLIEEPIIVGITLIFLLKLG